MKKKVLIAIGVVLVLAAIGGALPENNAKGTDAGSSAESVSETKKDSDTSEKAENKTPEEKSRKPQSTLCSTILRLIPTTLTIAA